MKKKVRKGVVDKDRWCLSIILRLERMNTILQKISEEVSQIENSKDRKQILEKARLLKSAIEVSKLFARELRALLKRIDLGRTITAV